MQRSLRLPVAPGTNVPPPHSYLHTWWFAIPATLRRFSVIISESWHDGMYLTAWPLVAQVMPPLLFVLGLAEGMTHWTFASSAALSTNETIVSFTELLPFMVLMAAASALSANFGLMLLLGYAVGDFALAGPQLTYFLPSNASPILMHLPPSVITLIYLRFPQLIAYAILFLFGIMPTLATKYLTYQVQPLLRALGIGRVLLQIVAMGLIQGAIMFAWTLTAPVMIRVYWSWINDSPPLAAAYFLQVQGSWIYLTAGVAAAVRGWLMFLAYRKPVLILQARQLNAELKRADLHKTLLRRLPRAFGAIFAAIGITLLLSGAIPGPTNGAIIALGLAVFLIIRNSILPRIPPWQAWMKLLQRIPLIIRLGMGYIIIFALVQRVLPTVLNAQSNSTAPSTPEATFLPLLVSIGISFGIMTLLMPGQPPARAAVTR